MVDGCLLRRVSKPIERQEGKATGPKFEGLELSPFLRIDCMYRRTSSRKETGVESLEQNF